MIWRLVSHLEQGLWWQKEKQTVIKYTRVLPGSVNAEVPKPFFPSVPICWWQSKYFREPKGESCSPRIIFLALGPGLLDPWAESLSRRTPDNMPLLPLPRWSLKPPADATFLLFHLAGAFLGASTHWQHACGAVF